MGLFGKRDTPIKLLSFKPTGAPFNVTLINAQVNKQDSDYIDISLSAVNESNKIIDAVSIGFDFFSVFNEFLEHIRGYSLTDIKPGKTNNMYWKYLIFEASLTGNVVAYPQKVRFKDGEIWEADIGEIERKIEETFHTKINIVEEENRKRLNKK